LVKTGTVYRGRLNGGCVDFSRIMASGGVARRIDGVGSSLALEKPIVLAVVNVTV
jgi:hypothetical protein